MDVQRILPHLPDEKVKKIQYLWNEFYQIYLAITGEEESVTDELIESVEHRTKCWLQTFVSIFQAKDVTPYMHILFAHCHQFIRLHGSLKKFTQQGCEKLNDMLTTSLFRSSNHRGIEALNQMFARLNRINILESRGVHVGPV
jgi:hypothetical protein